MFDDVDLNALATLVTDDVAGAAEEFDRRYRVRFQRFAQRAGLGFPDAQDVAQEVLASALLQLRAGDFRGESLISSWLHVILRRQIAAHWRRAGRLPSTTPLDIVLAADGDPAHESTSDPEASCILWSILDQLAPEDRQVLLLQARTGLKSREIGQRLHKPAGTVRHLVHDARVRFRELLNGTSLAKARTLLTKVDS